jgi:hypothetical protein
VAGEQSRLEFFQFGKAEVERLLSSLLEEDIHRRAVVPFVYLQHGTLAKQPVHYLIAWLQIATGSR